MARCTRRGPGVESLAVTDEKGKAAVLTEVSLILAAVFWGLNFVVTKYAAGFIPPLLLVALRFNVGGLLLLVVLCLLEPESKLRRKDVLPMLGLGCFVGYSAVFATAFAFTGWQRGISRIGANRVLVYQYLITLTGVASGVVLLGESLGMNKLLGGAVILLGVYLARRQ
jgi:drug/metabolite transporter (DMT)-like permease